MRLKKLLKSVVIFLKWIFLRGARDHIRVRLLRLTSTNCCKTESRMMILIMDPSDDPVSLSSKRNTIVASRLNDCVRMLNFLVEKQESVS